MTTARRKASKLSKRKQLENDFALQVKNAGLPAPEREHRFHPDRLWKIDFAWPRDRLAVEIQGGTWVGGAHGRGSGISKDAEKFANLAIMGWRLIAIPSEAVRSYEGLRWVSAVLKGDGIIKYPKIPGTRKIARGPSRKFLQFIAEKADELGFMDDLDFGRPCEHDSRRLQYTRKKSAPVKGRSSLLPPQRTDS